MATIPKSPTFSMHVPAPCAEEEAAIQNRAHPGSAAASAPQTLGHRKWNGPRARAEAVPNRHKHGFRCSVAGSAYGVQRWRQRLPNQAINDGRRAEHGPLRRRGPFRLRNRWTLGRNTTDMRTSAPEGKDASLHGRASADSMPSPTDRPAHAGSSGKIAWSQA